MKKLLTLAALLAATTAAHADPFWLYFVTFFGRG